MPPVFSVTSDQLNVWMVAFLWPFVRMLSLISTAPLFSEKSVPRTVKVGLAVLLAIAIAPTLGAAAGGPAGIGRRPLDTDPANPDRRGHGLFDEDGVCHGAGSGRLCRPADGPVLRLLFRPHQRRQHDGAGAPAERDRHADFSGRRRPPAADQTLAESFQTLPIADAPLAASGWFLLASAGSEIFLGGLILALPLIAALLTLNLAMGILNRVSPQFSIFAVGFPITLLAGIAHAAGADAIHGSVS